MTKTFPLLPDLTCPELAGYKLPSFPRSQEDDIEAMAKEEFNNIDNPIRSGIDNHSYKTGFAEGYRKAREKHEFTKEDLIDLVEWLVKADNSDNAEQFFGFSNNDMLTHWLSLRTTRTPIAIEVEMWPAIPGKDDKEIPKLNPDGTVKGRWVYE